MTGECANWTLGFMTKHLAEVGLSAETGRKQAGPGTAESKGSVCLTNALFTHRAATTHTGLHPPVRGADSSGRCSPLVSASKSLAVNKIELANWRSTCREHRPRKGTVQGSGRAHQRRETSAPLRSRASVRDDTYDGPPGPSKVHRRTSRRSVRLAFCHPRTRCSTNTATFGCTNCNRRARRSIVLS